MRATLAAMSGDDDEAEREAEALAELDEPPTTEAERERDALKCELCHERERMRTLPYCEDCATANGYTT